jgi:molybdate transport system substrate-binding protein
MRKTIVMLALLLGLAPAQAAEINVVTVGLVGEGFRELVAAWSKQTGHTVTLPIGPSPLGLVLEAMKTREVDAALLPMSEMPAQAPQFRAGSFKPIGRVLFGLGAKLNGPSPPIATEAQFRAALAGKTVLITDPAVSLNGRMAKEALAKPGYERVKVQAIRNSASVLPGSDADYVITVLPEELSVSNLKVVGEVPASLGLKIDFGGGVLTKAQNAELAQQFLTFLSSPQAQAVWKRGGVASPVPAN